MARMQLLQRSPAALERAGRLAKQGLLAVPLNTAVDARRRICSPAPPLARAVVANLSLAVATTIALPLQAAPLDPARFWATAVAAMGDVQAALARKDYAIVVWFAEALPGFLLQRMMDGLVAKPFLPCGVGNAGRVAPLPVRGGLEMVSLSVVFANPVRSAYTAVVTYADTMRLCVSSSRMAQAQIDSMADEVLGILTTVADWAA